MAQIPKRIYGFSPGESVEMVCRVEAEFVETGKDVSFVCNGHMADQNRFVLL